MTGKNPAVCVIDDDPQVTLSLESLLGVAGYEVLTFSKAENFLEQVEDVPAGSIILTDVCMPGLDGLELVKRLGGLAGAFPVVIMTGHASVPMAVGALRAGAADFVEKPFTRAELFDALERAGSRRNRAGGEDEDVPKALAERIESLSPREYEVMKLMIGGETSKIIARQLGISPRTVEVHRSHILRKMDARNLADLIHKAARLGIRPQTPPARVHPIPTALRSFT